jgi:hypothetical protein
MLKELCEFVRVIARDPMLLKDEELWAGVAVGTFVGFWCQYDGTAVPAIRLHLGELLKAEALVFGFVLTTLSFYVNASVGWAADRRVRRVAERLVNWHVWTVLCQLVALAYLILIWAFGERLVMSQPAKSTAYGILGFLTAYCGFQILNHVLTLRWVFLRRQTLRNGPGSNVGNNPDGDGEPGR